MLQLLIQVVLALLVSIFNIVERLLSWLPGIASRVLWLAQMAMAISCDVYRRVLTRLAPMGMRVGIDVLSNPWRIVACILLSVLLGVLLMLLMSWEVTPRGLGISAGHGLLVSMVWDQMGPPHGVRMGVH